MNWNDPGFLRNLSAVIQWVVIAFALFAVGLQTVKHFIDLREKRITSELSVRKDQANEEAKRELHDKLRQSEQRIRTLLVEAEIEVAAKWKDDKPPDPRKWSRVGGDGTAVSLVFALGSGAIVPAQFGASDGLRFTVVEDGRTLLRYTAVAKPDAEVFSLLPDQITGVEKIECAAFGVDRTGLADLHAVIRRLKLNFYVNGRPSFFVEVLGNLVAGAADNGQNETRFRFETRIPVVHSSR